MKIKKIVLLFMIGILLSNTAIGCAISPSQLETALNDYTRTLEGDIPEDLRLTIYYMDPKILTRMPLSVEDLKNLPETKQIIVESEKLTANAELLRKLDASILQQVKEESYINARLYYVFEVGSEILLEVTISEIHGSAVVNGIEVEDNQVLYELIAPFLTEEAQDILGI